MHLNGANLTGNIIVQAQQKIIVEANTALQDILLLAPEIEIKKEVRGSFQALASGWITVGANVKLAYPSALIVKRRQDSKSKEELGLPPEIHLAPGSEVRGIVAYLGNIEEQSYRPQIKLGDNALVMGEIYCTKNLELKGQVIGSVITDAFIALENGSIYQTIYIMAQLIA